MNEYMTKLSSNGRIVIPAKCRQLLGWSEGETLVIVVIDGEARVMSLRQALTAARQCVKSHIGGQKIDLVKRLLNERRKEAKDE